MKKIAIVTTTRAEYGLLAPLICELRKRESKDFKVILIVSGTHLSEAFGYTLKEIEADNLRVDFKIEVPVNSRTAMDISSNQAFALKAFTKLFVEEQFSSLVLLGDRYETLAIAIAAANTRTPIFHLCGGDTTEGAMDEWIRHSITKMSYLHFVTNEESRRRVIQLGENPERVFNYGSTSIDNIIAAADMTKKEALQSIGLEICDYAIGTYHPVTLGKESIEDLLNSFLAAIEAFPHIQFIITKANADHGGEEINHALERAEGRVDNLHLFASLGVKRYLSLMKHSMFVIGNSSSGIIEAPSFHIPTINIGERQKGRLQAESIINSKTSKEGIIKSIEIALSDSFRMKCKGAMNAYGDGHAAKKIAEEVERVIKSNHISLQKSFYQPY